MTRPMVLETICETNETIERQMSDAEYAQWQKDQLPTPTVGIQYP